MERGILNANVNNTGDYITTLIANGGFNSTSYAIFLQFIIVTYLFFRVGHGWFWRVLLIMSASGCIADLFQTSFTILYQKDSREWPRGFLAAAEPFWIISEFGVVLLNFLKLNTLISKRTSLVMKAALSILFLLFVVFRIIIGVQRVEKSSVSDKNGVIDAAHIPAFVVLSIAQLICSTAIIIVVRKGIISETQKLNFLRGLEKYLMRSSLFMLLVVDLVSVMLLIALAINSTLVRTTILPLLTTKSVAALIIAVDNITVRVLIASEDETRTRQLLLQSQTQIQTCDSVRIISRRNSKDDEKDDEHPPKLSPVMSKLSFVDSKHSFEKIPTTEDVITVGSDTSSCESISWEVHGKDQNDLLPMNFFVQDTPPSENGDLFRSIYS